MFYNNHVLLLLNERTQYIMLTFILKVQIADPTWFRILKPVELLFEFQLKWERGAPALQISMKGNYVQ